MLAFQVGLHGLIIGSALCIGGLFLFSYLVSRPDWEAEGVSPWLAVWGFVMLQMALGLVLAVMGLNTLFSERRRRRRR